MSTTETATETATERPVLIQRDIRKVESWQDVDRAMGVLRGCDAELGQIGADYDAQIADLQARKAKAVKPLVDKRARVEALITEYAEAHRADVEAAKKKSVKLVHGVVGWKKRAQAVAYTHSEQRTIQLIKARGLVSLLRVQESIDKPALKKLTQGEQVALGVRVTQSEGLYIELSQSPAIEYPSTSPSDGGDA